jgi:hypothetical protein
MFYIIYHQLQFMFQEDAESVVPMIVRPRTTAAFFTKYALGFKSWKNRIFKS